MLAPQARRIEPPLTYIEFPEEIMRPPRSIGERVFDVRRWTIAERGGHFVALEQPAALAEDFRGFFATL
ncbi:hypothetical protein [Hydrogenophaga palleronii]|uniref:hypothetical protein n=1 Tax=Hydrogenophaga palleronii TaxID=65655 RepID=UPI00082697BC|nr:hypothetical protein [Hydrogenophaga palleronii]